MIFLMSGTPGSGKSLHTASIILNQLRRGYDVIANFPVDLSHHKKIRGNFFYYPNNKLTPGLLVDFSKSYFGQKKIKEGELTLIIDESQLIFNARDWNAKGRSEWLSFFTQHRKFGYDIFLVAQFDRMIDRQIRSLVEYEIIHRKVSNFGWRGRIISFLFLGNLFVAVKVWYPLKEKTSSSFFRAHKSLYSIYDTYCNFCDAESEADFSAEDSGSASQLLDNNNT